MENLICMQQWIYTYDMLNWEELKNDEPGYEAHTLTQIHTHFTNTFNTNILPRRSCLENIVHGCIRSTVTMGWFLYGSMYRA